MILQPPATLLIGPAGSGKTYSIITALRAGLEVFVLVTEPDGVASLLDACRDMKLPMDNLHWATALPTSEGWDDLAKMLESVSASNQKTIADASGLDYGKASFRGSAIRLVSLMKNFVCDRTGVDYGDVTTWDDTRMFVVDTLTGWNSIAWGVTVGYKPTANPGEWGIAQNVIFNILKKVTNDRHCFFTLTAHVEKEIDEMSGVKKVTVSTLGAKLAPKIPPLFSEVVLVKKTVVGDSAAFTWSTLDAGADTKNRALPLKAVLLPDFKQVVDAYKARKVQASGIATAQLPMGSGNPTPKPVVVQTAPMVPVAKS